MAAVASPAMTQRRDVPAKRQQRKLVEAAAKATAHTTPALVHGRGASLGRSKAARRSPAASLSLTREGWRICTAPSQFTGTFSSHGLRSLRTSRAGHECHGGTDERALSSRRREKVYATSRSAHARRGARRSGPAVGLLQARGRREQGGKAREGRPTTLAAWGFRGLAREAERC